VIDPVLEMRRLAGKFALFLAGAYALVVYVGMLRVWHGTHLPTLEWVLLPVPALAFVPSVVDAVRLHRTKEPARMKVLWRRSLALAVLGTVALFAEALLFDRMNRP
jgi:hypothetical protein